MAAIAFDSIHKSFGPTNVLRGITLEAKEGEFVVFVGPSGCGKTTLLRILAGLETPSSGTIRIAGSIANDVPAQHRNIAMVFQNYALFPHMTAEENIGFGLMVRGMGRQERRARIAEAAEKLDLTPYLKRLPRELSGGQRQRVAMGRAMVRDPVALLMDEPLSNLDAQLRVQVRAELKRLQRRLGVTTIYVTHDQVEAMTMADRVAVLRDGVLEQYGTPGELYERPNSAFVAGFIGQPGMNFLRARRVEGTRFSIGAGHDLDLPADRLDHWSGDGDLLIGVRPTHVEIPPEAAEGRFRWSAPVSLAEPLGAETLIHASLGGQKLLAMTDRRHAPGDGERVDIAFPLDRAYLFAEGTGACVSQAPNP